MEGVWLVVIDKTPVRRAKFHSNFTCVWDADESEPEVASCWEVLYSRQLFQEF